MITHIFAQYIQLKTKRFIFRVYFIMETDLALEIIHVQKNVERGKRKVKVLRHLRLEIPRGNIYVLLGRQNSITKYIL